MDIHLAKELMKTLADKRRAEKKEEEEARPVGGWLTWPGSSFRIMHLPKGQI